MFDDWTWGRKQCLWLRRMIREIGPFRVRADLHRSSFWQAEGEGLERLLVTIQTGCPPKDTETLRNRTARSDSGALRVVHWNIQKGISFEGIVRELTEHPRLRWPDILLLNEVDMGMARSANRHVAAELAGRLGLHWAFIPSYLELTKGPGAEAEAPGENELALHGVAVLTREEPLALVAPPLPECFDYFSFSEKRLGRRIALLANLPGGLVVGTAHLEVRSTPACRARQMLALLDATRAFCAAQEKAGSPPRRILLSGDFNTHTFPRGTLVRSVGGFLRLLLTPNHLLRHQLEEPWRRKREPLFEHLRQRGYSWEGLNDRRPTARAPLDTIEEIPLLPAAAQRLLDRMLGMDQGGIPLRLDWFAGRGISVASGHGPPRAVEELLGDPAPSDHVPLVLEIQH